MSYVLLYWNYGENKWTTNKSFSPNSDTSTFGGQYFILPPYFKVINDVIYYSLFLPNSVTKGTPSGSLSLGSGKDYAGPDVNGGDFLITGNISNNEQTNLTTNELKLPQGVFPYFTVTFLPAPNLKIRVKAYV